jgi:hypothetical protein
MTASPVTLLRTSDVAVTEHEATITFRPIGTVMWGLGIGSVVLGIAFRFVDKLEGGLGGFGVWASWVLMACGALLIVKGITRHVGPPWVLDAHRRSLMRGRTRVPFEDLSNVQVTSTRVGATTAIALRVDTTTAGQIWLVTGQMEKWRDEIQRVADRIKVNLGNHEIPALTVVASPRSFLIPFALTLGSVWGAGLWWFAPNLVLTYPHARFGLRMWPLGLWIAALGIAELARLPVFELMLGPWNRQRAGLFAIWMGSYAAVSYTTIVGS